MVYDGMGSGLNEALLVPSFGLPNIDSHLSGISDTTWLGDYDLRETLLSFQLDLAIQPHYEVDLTQTFPEEAAQGKIIWEKWTQCMMGLKPQPYNRTQGMSWAEEVIRGDHCCGYLVQGNDQEIPYEVQNSFCWDLMRLNFSACPSYDPRLP